MKNLDDVIIRAEQLESMFYAIETELIETNNGSLDDGAYNAYERAVNLLYIFWEQWRQIEKELDELTGHIEVCNAIFAVNRVEELKAEIESLKTGN